ncbi:MAG: deoxyribodipyrimidine photolyase [Polyangiales bacterium]
MTAKADVEAASPRVRVLNDRPERPRGAYVLYWMIAARRASWSFALDAAVSAARRLDRPLLVLEALRSEYPWASDRLHAYVLSGMVDNARAFAKHGVTYHAYVEPEHGAGKGLLAALAAKACLVVTDDYPAFFLPHMLARAASALDVRLVAVDGNGLMPMRALESAPPTAYAFRRTLQRALPAQLAVRPRAQPLGGALLRDASLPRGVLRRWPRASEALLAARPEALAALPIDHGVPKVRERGGSVAARKRLRAFVREGLARYGEARNDPDADAGSGLSGWLHFGHVSVHEVFWTLADHEGWDLTRLGSETRGRRAGFWGMSEAAESFLDEVVTWRELGYVWASLRPDYDAYASLPDWAQRTLDKHAKDPRDPRYDRATLEAAETHDALWNAAQRQLVREGRIHNYLRMLWGKKVLEWTRSPREALTVLTELNNRWAVDGRDPNSYTGILWVLGRHDRPWAPERKVFGTVRYMSSDNTRRKLDVTAYLKRFGP